MFTLNNNMLENLPKNWKLVEEYEGNYIFEDKNKNFQVSIDDMGSFLPRYEINFQQLKGTILKIGYSDGAYSTYALIESEATEKAIEMMIFINKKIKKDFN